MNIKRCFYCLENFCRKIIQLNKNKKITNQQLANELNLTRQSISQFTKGTAMPSIEKLIAIADFFNISIDELLGRKMFLVPLILLILIQTEQYSTY